MTCYCYPKIIIVDKKERGHDQPPIPKNFNCTKQVAPIFRKLKHYQQFIIWNMEGKRKGHGHMSYKVVLWFPPIEAMQQDWGDVACHQNKNHEGMLSHPLHKKKQLLVTINIHLKIYIMSMASQIHVAHIFIIN